MTQPKILLAGAESHLLAMARIFFENKGYSVFVAESEEEALEKSAAEEPDFILLQFWEEPERFNAAALAPRLAAGRRSRLAAGRRSRLAVFCLTDLKPDALKHFLLSQVLVYKHIADFKEKALGWLKGGKPGAS